METSPPSQLPPQDKSLSLTLLPPFLSFIFCLISIWREWAAFLGTWCPLPAFRICFVEFSQCWNDLSMILWGRKWSPHPIPPPSSALPPKVCSLHLCFFFCPGWFYPQPLWAGWPPVPCLQAWESLGRPNGTFMYKVADINHVGEKNSFWCGHRVNS